MFNMLALSHEDTEKLLDMETVIEKVETAYKLKHEKNAATLANDLPRIRRRRSRYGY